MAHKVTVFKIDNKINIAPLGQSTYRKIYI